MIHAELKLPDGRIIKVLIRERTYKKMTANIKCLSFFEKIKLLFTGK